MHEMRHVSAAQAHGYKDEYWRGLRVKCVGEVPLVVLDEISVSPGTRAVVVETIYGASQPALQERMQRHRNSCLKQKQKQFTNSMFVDKTNSLRDE